jgi:hypothetical protein
LAQSNQSCQQTILWRVPAALAFRPAEKQVETVMPQGDIEETKAVALLPNLKIEITHGRLPAGDAERLTISVLAVPSFEAFGRYLDAANPFLFWMRFAQTAWAPWLSAFPTSTPRSGLGGRYPTAHIAAPSLPSEQDGKGNSDT